MTVILAILVSFFLPFNGIEAIYCRGTLINRPDRGRLTMLSEMDCSVCWVWQHYFYILKTIHGFITSQGIILTGWIVIQVTKIRVVSGLHFVYGTVGLLLIIAVFY